MTSKITIEVNLSTYMPYIRVIHDPKSDDVRDKLIKEFIDKLDSLSFWARIQFMSNSDDRNTFHIIPLEPMDLEEHGKIMSKNSVEYFKSQRPVKEFIPTVGGL